MELGAHSDHEPYRAIVLGPEQNDVFLVSTFTGFHFPTVEIPRSERIPENLTATMKSHWDCEACCLFPLGVPFPDKHPEEGTRYQVMKCWGRTSGQADGTQWMSLRDLTPESFRDVADYRALQQCLAECLRYRGMATSPFADIGWFAELRTWVAEVIRPRGLELSGNFRQLNASPSFSLIRFATNGPAVWFKATGAPNQREFSITIQLAQLFPAYVPSVLGTHPEWNGWLTLECEGSSLHEPQPIAFWNAAMASLAKLQASSIGNVQALLDAGARDLRSTRLAELVLPFLEVAQQLMRQQTKIPPPVLTNADLIWLGDQIRASLARIEARPIPDTLGHLDLNPGNIVVSTNRCTFLDWAEAYIGHPFFSLAYLLEHFRRARSADAAAESQLPSCYTQPWADLFPAETIIEAFAVTPLLAVFAYAVGNSAWTDSERLRDTRVAGYLRSLVRRMHHEAAKINSGRSRCQS